MKSVTEKKMKTMYGYKNSQLRKRDWFHNFFSTFLLLSVVNISNVFGYDVELGLKRAYSKIVRENVLLSLF